MNAGEIKYPAVAAAAVDAYVGCSQSNAAMLPKAECSATLYQDSEYEAPVLGTLPGCDTPTPSIAGLVCAFSVGHVQLTRIP